jgi:hypothetical protein
VSAIPWVLLGCGVFSFFYVRDLESKQRASRTWPRVTGRLLQVRPKEQSGNFDDDLLIPFVQYEYRVDGELHFGSEIDFSGSAGVEPEVFDRKVAGLRPGDAVPVSYDPRDPRRSVLRPGEAGEEELGRLSVTGWLLGAGGILVLVVEWSTGMPIFDALRAWLA